MRMMFGLVHHSFSLLGMIAQKLVYFAPCFTLVPVQPENLLIKKGRDSYLKQLPGTVTVGPIFLKINLVIILIFPNNACLQKLNKEVVIGGVSYKTSSNKLTKTRASSTEKQSGRGMKSLSASKIGEPFVTFHCTFQCQKSGKNQLLQCPMN